MSEPSFESLCLPLRSALLSKAIQMTRDPQDAQDLVQETLLLAMEKWHTFTMAEGVAPEARASVWLHGILRNTCITTWRRRARRDEVFEAWPLDAEAIHGDSEAGDVELWPDNLSPELESGLLALKKSDRELIVLADLRSHSEREIAVYLGVPKGTIKSRLSRARRRLAEILAPGRLEAPRLALTA